MTNCVICGKPIKSGWKYCWEHRNTKTANTYGLPSRRTRFNAHIESTNYTVFFGICLIIPAFLVMLLIDDWGVKAFALFFFLMGLLLMRIGLKSRKNIKKYLIKDELHAKKNREELWETARKEVDEERKHKKKWVWD